MRQDGVTFPDNRRLRFASLTPLTGSVLHAEGVAPVARSRPRTGQEQRVADLLRPAARRSHGAAGGGWAVGGGARRL